MSCSPASKSTSSTSWRWLLLAAALTSLSRASFADGFDLDPYAAPAPGARFFFPATTHIDQGQAAVSVGLTSDTAFVPLTLYTWNQGVREQRVQEIVTEQSVVHVRGSVAVLGVARLDVTAPAQVFLRGTSESVDPDVPTPQAQGMGDLRAGVSVRIAGKEGGPVNVNGALHLRFPTGSPEGYNGEHAVRWEPEVSVSGTEPQWAWGLSLRGMLRRPVMLSNTEISHELVLGGAAGLRSKDGTLLVGPELLAHVVVAGQSAGVENTTGVEVLMGAHKRWGAWRLGLGAGPGLARGIGTPAARVLLELSYVPGPRGKNQSDRDHDGVLDAYDACPDVPGRRTDDPKTNGCPAPEDRDHDGVIDREDACPDEPGPRTGKRPGCPPPKDRDGDGIVDDEDACPGKKGPRTVDPRTCGCPVVVGNDRDGDGILDREDACPTLAGPRRPEPSQNGCPRLVRLTETKIEILERIYFETAKANILPVSTPVLEQVARVLREHPGILKVRVEGHTDSRGGWLYNLGLSQRRAASVVRWLVQHGGIDPNRLEPHGYGLDRPIADNSTPEGRQKNRRVEFRIVERVPDPPKKGGAVKTYIVVPAEQEGAGR